MALTDQERERIREEEWIRLQARQDFNRHNRGTLGTTPRIMAFAGVFVTLALLLFSLARTS